MAAYQLLLFKTELKSSKSNSNNTKIMISQPNHIFNRPSRGFRWPALFLGILFMGNLLSADESTARYLEEISKEKTFWGEPYELAGKRLFFTDFFYIRPGALNWLNEEGVRINEVEEGLDNPVYGAWDAQLSRPSSPFGIRIEAQQAQRKGPVIKREKPWEEEYIIFKTVMKDGDIYKAWGKKPPGRRLLF